MKAYTTHDLTSTERNLLVAFTVFGLQFHRRNTFIDLLDTSLILFDGGTLAFCLNLLGPVLFLEFRFKLICGFQALSELLRLHLFLSLLYQLLVFLLELLLNLCALFLNKERL